MAKSNATTPEAYLAELQEGLREAFAWAGNTLDMGKSCIRFKRAEDLPLVALGKIIGDMPPERLIARYETARR